MKMRNLIGMTGALCVLLIAGLTFLSMYVWDQYVLNVNRQRTAAASKARWANKDDKPDQDESDEDDDDRKRPDAPVVNLEMNGNHKPQPHETENKTSL